MSRPKLKNNLLKSAFWLTLAEIVFNLSGYIVHAFVGRILGPAGYGRYALVVTFTTMIIILIGRGIPTAMSKYLSQFFERKPQLIPVIKKQATFLQTIVISIVTLLFLLFAPVIARALGDPTLTPLFRISSLIIPAFAAAAFYVQYFTGLHKFHIQSILKTIRGLSKIIFIILLAYLFQVPGSIIGYILAPLLVFGVALAIDFITQYNTTSNVKKGQKHENTKTRKHSSLKKENYKDSNNYQFNWKILIQYAWPFTLFMLFYEILINTDLYFIKALLKNDALTGIYNSAATIGRLPYYFFYALTIILLPTISKLKAEKNKKEIKKILNKTLELIIFFLLPATILISAYAGNLVQLFYGNKYLLAGKPLQLLVFGISFSTVFYILSFAINGAGLVKIPMKIAAGGLLINLILNYFLIQKYALLGAALSTSISSFLIMIFILFYLSKNFAVNFRLKLLTKSIICAILIYNLSFLISYLIPVNQWSFIPSATVLAVIYWLLLYKSKEIKKEDLKVFKKIF